MDEESLRLAAWFPGEDVCRKEGFDLPWLKVQRRMRKGFTAEAGAFTVSMLENKPRLNKGLKGLKDAQDVHELAHWLKMHPKREYTEEQREALKKRLLGLRRGKEASA